MNKPRFIGIGGGPGTGKSTLMKRVLMDLGHTLGEPSIHKPWPEWKQSLMRIYHAMPYGVIGPYDHKPFPGTDRLSMGIMGTIDLWGYKMITEFTGYSILFEGDRLFNANFLTWLKTHAEVHLFYLGVDEALLPSRYAERGSNQNESWLRGRKTMWANIQTKFPGTVLANNTHEQSLANAGEIFACAVQES